MHSLNDNDCQSAALVFACRQFLRTAEGNPVERDECKRLLASCNSDDEIRQCISRWQYAGYTLAPEYEGISWASMPGLILDHAQFTYAGALAQAKQMAQQLSEPNRPYLDRKTWWPQLRIKGELPAEEVMALTEVSMAIQKLMNQTVVLAHVVFDHQGISSQEAVDRWVTAVESAGADDAVDDQDLLKEAGLALREPVEHLSIAELDDHMNKLSRDLYYSAVELAQTESDELAGRVRPSAPGFSM
ncbi:hypothetical protein [Marinobacterium sp. BA1]|uniref:hypothetical protein n=1 Tax=Marinobacterium sp. BA1 TaxID=3138931 RepID=UPI0032E5A113